MNWFEHYKVIQHRIRVEAPMQAGMLEIKPVEIKTVEIVMPEPPENIPTSDTALVEGLYPRRFAPLLLPALREYGIPFHELKSKGRARRYQIPRFKMYSLMREHKYSLSEIGGVFNRDHTSILHGIQRWKEINGG